MNTLGRVIRAARLGWYAAPSMNAWVRVSDDGGRITVELAPIANLPPAKTATKNYRCIGLDGSGAGTEADPEIIELSPVLAAIKQVKRHVKLILNDDGTLARAA